MRLIYLIILVWIYPILAAEYQLEKKQFTLEHPQDWKVVYGAHDIDLTILSTDQKNKTVISIMPSTEVNNSLKAMLNESFKQAFVNGKIDSLKLGGIDEPKLLTYEIQKDSEGEYMEIAFLFNKGQDEWMEQSHYRDCGGSFYLIRAISKHKGEYSEQALKILRSFRCKK